MMTFTLKKLKEVPMLGFEHPSHMVTHPSTDEAQCCLSLEILVNSSKKEESRIKSPLRIEGTKNNLDFSDLHNLL